MDSTPPQGTPPPFEPDSEATEPAALDGDMKVFELTIEEFEQKRPSTNVTRSR
ncbi:MAG: hypothetical protein ABIG85_04425 [Chloroflexota bacterium]